MCSSFASVLSQGHSPKRHEQVSAARLCLHQAASCLHHPLDDLLDFARRPTGACFLQTPLPVPCGHIFRASARHLRGRGPRGRSGAPLEAASCILPLTLLPYPMQAMCGGPWPCQLARGLRRSGQCIRCPDAPSWDWDWPAVFYTASRRDHDAEDSSCVPFASLARPGLRRLHPRYCRMCLTHLLLCCWPELISVYSRNVSCPGPISCSEH